MESEIVWADQRATRHAWPESTVALIMPDSDKVVDVQLKAGDDASEALWMDVTEENVASLSFSSHPGFVMIAADAWQKEKDLVIAKDGRVGRA